MTTLAVDTTKFMSPKDQPRSYKKKNAIYLPQLRVGNSIAALFGMLNT